MHLFIIQCLEMIRLLLCNRLFTHRAKLQVFYNAFFKNHKGYQSGPYDCFSISQNSFFPHIAPHL
jgi:hypothetical protein